MLRPRATPQRPIQPVTTMPAPQPVNAPSPRDDFGVSELMISSLPPMASGADVYMRQFYRPGSSLPSRRYLPLRGL